LIPPKTPHEAFVLIEVAEFALRDIELAQEVISLESFADGL